MNWEKEEKILEDYLQTKNLKHSEQRKEILIIFLKNDKHLTANELYRIVQAKYPAIGYATIYRTLKLLCECGLCRELKFEDGTTRYEHLYNHQHHDHLICTGCGEIAEFENETIEKLQESVAASHGFTIYSHKLDLYGLCAKCGK